LKRIFVASAVKEKTRTARPVRWLGGKDLVIGEKNLPSPRGRPGEEEEKPFRRSAGFWTCQIRPPLPLERSMERGGAVHSGLDELRVASTMEKIKEGRPPSPLEIFV